MLVATRNSIFRILKQLNLAKNKNKTVKRLKNVRFQQKHFDLF